LHQCQYICKSQNTQTGEQNNRDITMRSDKEQKETQGLYG